MNTNHSHTHTFLRRARFAAGMSAIELAAAVPCSRMTLYRIEHNLYGRDGAQPRVRVGLERVLGISYDLLAAPDTQTQNDPALLSEAAGVPKSPAPHRGD